MDRRSLGKTGHQVTRIGLGLAALGRPGYINLGHGEDLCGAYEIDSMRNHAHRVLDAAWQAGVRYFDAARSYGRAEEFLGSWLAERKTPPDETTIGSKWGYTYTADWNVQLPDGEQHEVKEHTLPVLNRQFGESWEILRDQLDLYQIHSATLESGVLENDAVISRLAELRDVGLTVGFSVSGPQQAETILRGIEVERGGKLVFQSVQATWNLLEQSAGDALAEAHLTGFGVIVKEALANGRLTSRNSDARFQARHQRLHQFAAAHDVTIDAVALACVLRQPCVDVVLSGAASTEHLAANLRSLAFTQYSELDELLAFAEPAEQYWSIRSRMSWN